MWQLSFLLSLIPNWLIAILVNGLIIVGLVGVSAGWIARWVPYFNLYRGPIQLIGIVCLVLGVYFKGGADVERAWRERVAEVEARLAVAEQKSVATNTKIDTVAQEKIRVIRGQTQIVRQYIDREVVRYDTKFLPGGQCEIPQEFIQAHNKSTERTK